MTSTKAEIGAVDDGGRPDAQEVSTDVLRISAGELKAFVPDAGEIAKGTRLLDSGALSHLARYQNKLFCDAKGSGPAPYKVSLAFTSAPQPVFKVRCTCPARTFNAASTAFCKHATALLVAWARAPESFVVSDTAPAGAAGASRRKQVKRGDASAESLMKAGVEQVSTLVRELGVAGVAAVGDDRDGQLENLAARLRENKLRRLSARTLDLSRLLRGTTAGAPGRPPVPAGPAPAALELRPLPAAAYANIMADLLLTARKLEKHLAGEPIDDRHVEELIGKTWKASDKTPVAGLDLIEYAFLVRTTSDEYLIRESRFFDVASGKHFSEKQILPAFLAKRTEPKRSFAGHLLAGIRGSTFPGYPPVRLDLADLGDKRPVDAGALTALLERALPDVDAALAALQDHRKDVFAPDVLPVAVRTSTLFARGTRLAALDDKNSLLHLPEDAALDERIAAALRGVRLRALLGDVGLDAALPTLWPLAAVVEGPLGLTLQPLFGDQGGALRSAPREGSTWGSGRSAPNGAPAPRASTWNETAREAGASAAAILLGEIREELADALVAGLAGLTDRSTEPWIARLRELGLEKQAALLASLPKRPEPQDRIDDFIKLYQVLEIALVRLVAATQVDRGALVRAPAYESVCVEQPDEALPPAEVARRRASGEMNRYAASVQDARHYEALPLDEVATRVFPMWADGTAAPFIAKALAARGGEAVRAAERALTSKTSRVAKLTAVRVLHAVAARGGEAAGEAEAMVSRVAQHAKDAALQALSRDVLDALAIATPGGDAVRARRAAALENVHALGTTMLTAPTKEERADALKALVERGDLTALPALRRAFHADPSRAVREEAAYALGQLGDTEMVETLVRMLRSRGEDDREAKIAAYALGFLGDVRGLDELLSAYADGYKPSIVAEALRAFGPVVLEPLVDLVEARPELAKRAATLDVFKKLEDTAVAQRLLQRLEARRGQDGAAEVAQIYLRLAEAHPRSKREVASAVLAIFGSAGDKAALAAAKAARRALGAAKVDGA